MRLTMNARFETPEVPQIRGISGSLSRFDTEVRSEVSRIVSYSAGSPA